MNSRRCIQTLKVTFEGTRFPVGSDWVQGRVQECFLYTLVATTLACGESDPKLLVSIRISNGLREPSRIAELLEQRAHHVAVEESVHRRLGSGHGQSFRQTGPILCC